MTSPGRAAKKIDKLKDNLESAAENGLRRGMRGPQAEMKRMLRQNDSVATGNLVGHIELVPGTPRGKAISKWKIIAPEYWKYLEYGTGIYTSQGYKAPGAPPYYDILTWIKTKGIVPSISGPADTQEELAAAIARSIQTGTEQHPFARPAWRGPAGKEYLIESVTESMQFAVDRSL